MTDIEVSRAKSLKLDELDKKVEEIARKIDHAMLLISGDGKDAPGFLSRLGLLERLLLGDESIRFGIVTKVNVLWHVHVWVLCTCSAAAGFAFREVVKLIWKV